METLWAVLVSVGLVVGGLLCGEEPARPSRSAPGSCHPAGRPGRTRKARRQEYPATTGLVSWPGGWVVPACVPYAWKGCELE